MTPGQLETIEETFHAALDCEPGQLSAFLDKTCAGDEVLRGKVEALLASHQRAGNFIQTPVAALATRVIENRQTDLLIGQMIGHYQILKRIGAGGSRDRRGRGAARGRTSGRRGPSGLRHRDGSQSSRCARARGGLSLPDWHARGRDGS